MPMRGGPLSSLEVRTLIRLELPPGVAHVGLEANVLDEEGMGGGREDYVIHVGAVGGANLENGAGEASQERAPEGVELVLDDLGPVLGHLDLLSGRATGRDCGVVGAADGSGDHVLGVPHDDVFFELPAGHRELLVPAEGVREERPDCV